MSQKLALLKILVFGIFLSCVSHVWAASVDSVTLSPALDISYFDSYTLSTSISDYLTTSPVSVDIVGVNGDGGAAWQYYANGTAASSTLTYSMTYDSGTTWKKTSLRPDAIYPQIFYAPSSITWYTTPLDTIIRRNAYHIFHVTNPFTMEGNMSFWVEFNTTPVSTVNSADLLIYLVKKGKSTTFFQSDWRDSADVELIGSFNKDSTVNHTHTGTSAHYLIPLTTNADATVGAKSLDVSGDFWIILYNISPNNARGWNLRYHPSSLCTNSNGWYIGNQTGWTTTAQAGCPDLHFHVARRTTHPDGVKATVTAGSASKIQEFSFGVLPNLKPNASTFTIPTAGAYAGTMNITWNEATDPNGDTISYTVELLNSEGTVVGSPLVDASALLTSAWDTTKVSNGTYSLRGKVCDDQVPSLCSEYFYSSSFTINNASTIYALSSISISSSGSDSTIAKTGNTVTLTFTATGTITTPTVTFYSGGNSVKNAASVTNIGGNTWRASYMIDSSDTSGQISFSISSTTLQAVYNDTTNSSTVTVDTAVTSSQSSGSSSTSSTSPSSTSCTNAKPSIPDLFQITVHGTSATLYYTPLNSNNSNYFIGFGEKSGSFEHGTFTGQGQSSGVLSYTVSYLKPNTTYYFKVRGQNICMPGEWSNEIHIKTGNTFLGETILFYKGGSTNNSTKSTSSSLKSYATNLISEPESIKPSPTQAIQQPIQSAPPPVAKKKYCFLWWCWN